MLGGVPVAVEHILAGTLGDADDGVALAADDLMDRAVPSGRCSHHRMKLVIPHILKYWHPFLGVK